VHGVTATLASRPEVFLLIILFCKLYTCSSMQCSRCEREYEYDRAKGHRRTICNSCNVTLFRQKIKERAVKYLGGKCKCCDYNLCVAALDFHHLDPSQKDFGISEGGVPRKWSKIQQELDKCVLVCNRCHAEIHAGIRNIPL